METPKYIQKLKNAKLNLDILLGNYRNCFLIINGNVNINFEESLSGNWKWDDEWDGELIKVLIAISDLGFNVGAPSNRLSALRNGKILIKDIREWEDKIEMASQVQKALSLEGFPIKNIQLGGQSFVIIDMKKMKSNYRKKRLQK